MSGILGRSHRERFAKSLQRISWPSNEIQMRKPCRGENWRAADMPGIRTCNILGINASLTPVWTGSPIGWEIKVCLASTHSSYSHIFLIYYLHGMFKLLRLLDLPLSSAVLCRNSMADSLLFGHAESLQFQCILP